MTTFNQTPMISPNELPGRKQNEAIIAAVRGKLNNRGKITLTANSATTTLTDERIGANSVIQFSPSTANARADVPYYDDADLSQGSATLHHTNNAQVDKTFRYTVTG